MFKLQKKKTYVKKHYLITCKSMLIYDHLFQIMMLQVLMYKGPIREVGHHVRERSKYNDMVKIYKKPIKKKSLYYFYIWHTPCTVCISQNHLWRTRLVSFRKKPSLGVDAKKKKVKYIYQIFQYLSSYINNFFTPYMCLNTHFWSIFSYINVL